MSAAASPHKIIVRSDSNTSIGTFDLTLTIVDYDSTKRMMLMSSSSPITIEMTHNHPQPAGPSRRLLLFLLS